MPGPRSTVIVLLSYAAILAYALPLGIAHSAASGIDTATNASGTIARSVVGGAEIVFDEPAEVYLDGQTCLYSAEGKSASLPVGVEPYTIEASIKIEGGSPSGGIIGWGHDEQDHAVNALRLGGSFNTLQATWWNDDMIVKDHPDDLIGTYGASLNDGNYHRITTSWDGSYRKLFIDGTLFGLLRATTGPFNMPAEYSFCVGKTFAGHFTGHMKDIRVYKGAVDPQPSPAESPAAPPPPPPSSPSDVLSPHPPPSPPAAPAQCTDFNHDSKACYAHGCKWCSYFGSECRDRTSSCPI